MKDSYGFGKTVSYSFDDAITKVTQALQNEGFGVLSDIDVAATLKKKLNVDSAPYRILGACNPTLAHRALEIEPSIGLLLPCNVVVRTKKDNKTEVEILDPNIIANLVNKSEILSLSAEAKERLKRVLDSL